MNSSGYQNALSWTVNRLIRGRAETRDHPLLHIGDRIGTDSPVIGSTGIPLRKRTEHLAVLGKTGSGKTSLLRYLCSQDIRAGHGLAFFDLHGDTTPFLLGLVAEEERRRGYDLSKRVVLIDPSDRANSIGINLLDAVDEQDAFVEIAEVVEILKHRWKLDTLGVRTDELLRNALFVLHANHLSILEVSPLLTNAAFRSRCMTQVRASEARRYFEERYDMLSPQMQGVYREAILNKISLYTADPHFRHMLGQVQSSVDLRNAVDSGAFVLFNLEKGRLGEETATIAALLLAKLKHAILSRKTRRPFTIYCDEVQNLVAYDQAIDVLLSEARKFGVSIVTANQYLDQYDGSMRAAILAMGAHAFLQLSGLDAERVGHWFGMGRKGADLLRNLPPRHLVLRQGSQPPIPLAVPPVVNPSIIPVGLVRRVRSRVTRPRSTVEREIQARIKVEMQQRKEVLHESWD